MTKVDHRLAILETLDMSKVMHGLSRVTSRPFPSPMIYASSPVIAELNGATAGNELAMGACSLLSPPPYLGRFDCYDKDGNILWTYNSPTNAYVDGACAGDINGDGNQEIAVSYNEGDDAGATLLANDGTFLWHYAAPNTGAYCRCVRIGKVRNDIAGQQLVMGGRDGFLDLVDKDGNLIWTKTVGAFNTIQEVRIADMDGDGQAEIYFVLELYLYKYDHLGNYVWKVAVTPSIKVFGLAVGIIGGVMQIVTAAENGGVKLIDKDGNILWTKTTPYKPQCVEIGDINNDGVNEIVVGWAEDEYSTSCPAGVTVFDKDGDVIGVNRALPSCPPFMAIGDTNNDGENEIAAPCNNGRLYILKW